MEVHIGNANNEEIKIDVLINTNVLSLADELVRQSGEHNHFPNPEDI